MKLGRRMFLGMGLAGSAALASSSAQAGLVQAGAGTPVDQTPLGQFIKMRGSLDNRLVIGSVTGQYVGVQDGNITPLFGVVSVVFSRYREQGGGYAIVEFEQAYYTDLETGKVLSRFKNPYTNEMVTVPTYDGPTDRFLVTENLQFHSAVPPPSTVQVQHFAEAPDTTGEDIVFVERVLVSVAAAEGKPAFQYTDHTTLRAKRRDVAEPSLKMAGSRTRFEAACSWRPWLGMGDRPGHLAASGDGGFGVKLADLPAAWLDATSTLKPELLTHPERNLD